MPCFLTALPTLVRTLQEAGRERESSLVSGIRTLLLVFLVNKGDT